MGKEREEGVGFRVKHSTSEMVSSRRCLMEYGSRRLAFFGVTFAGVAAAQSLAMCAAATRSWTRREVVVDGAGESER